ncbi:MAG: hypothetical protein HY966_00410 [Ignavibacteriales bacterium]|nr:hypothetical protein [Ignavibacteriales bacterium]
MIQTELFESDYIVHYEKHKIRYEFPVVGDVTFLNGLSEPVHRWFRLTPSYSPELVRYLVQELRCDRETLVCDPFLGKGTTGIELKKLGIPFVGIEINPLLKLASEYALTWEVEQSKFAEHWKETLAKIEETIDGFKGVTLENVIAEKKLKLPPIHDVFRWWKKYVLRDLLLIKESLGKVRNENYKRLYWIALCSSVLDCANIHRNHPTISFDDNHKRKIDVLGDFKENIEHILADLKRVPPREKTGKANILLGDSTHIASVVPDIIDRVITSPPYPNRFSYVHTTRPQLFFMDVFENATQSADLDCAAIGGTWGKATSVLYNGVVEPYEHLSGILQPMISELRPKHNLMCNYAVKYFNMMDDHIADLKNRITNKFRGAYIVGNSRLKGVEILTEVVLAKMFEHQGFTVDKLLVFRKRGGKKKLYETAVCVSR